MDPSVKKGTSEEFIDEVAGYYIPEMRVSRGVAQ
jgi:hypothetical protein